MRITKISPSRTDESRVIVYFEDRSYFKVDVLMCHELGLKPGMEVDSEILPMLDEDSRKTKARESAARILGRRNMSRHELLRKLKDKGICQEDADYAADWARDIGVINDEAYAASLVEYYRLRGFGDKRVRQELLRRGIGRDVTDNLLAEDVDMSDEIMKFIEKKLRGSAPDPDTTRKLTAALVRRGHSFEDIRSAFRQLAIEMEDTY